MNALEMRGIAKAFGGLRVLTNINITVAQNERHVVIGPNGAGKSTLFNIISGKLAPDSGEVIYDGKDIAGLPPEVIARSGLARSFQIINVFPGLSVSDNVRSAVASRLGKRRNFWQHIGDMADVTDETARILSLHGLAGCASSLASELSYGDQRRLEIALSVALDPKILLLDEPCAGLNSDDTAVAISLIRRVSEGRTLIMVEHDMNVVFGLADRISVVHYGQVIASGRPDQIRDNEIVKAAYLGNKAHVTSS